MPGFLDATCRVCGKRFGWTGKLTDRPPCPGCGDVIPQSELEADEKEMEAAMKEIFNRKNKNKNKNKNNPNETDNANQ